MVALAFKDADRAGGFFSKAIKWKTGGTYSHVELALSGDFENALCFSSREPEGTSFTHINLTDSNLWTIVPLNLNLFQEYEIQIFCQGTGHKRYDFLGILGFVWPWGEHDDYDRFCSEFCCEALQKILGWFPGIKPWMVSPIQLYNMVQDVLRKSSQAEEKVSSVTNKSS